jgi:hypothetical protein
MVWAVLPIFFWATSQLLLRLNIECYIDYLNGIYKLNDPQLKFIGCRPGHTVPGHGSTLMRKCYAGCISLER